MKDLIIVCAGGFGRELITTINRINEIEPTWNIKGFIDDNPDVLIGIKCDYKIIGSISNYEPLHSDYLALGVSSPATKEKIVNIMHSKGVRFETIISPFSNIAEYVTMGEGCVIGGSIGDNVTLGNFVNIAGSMIGQGSVIGDYSTTTGFVNIASARLGKRVFVGSHAVVLNNIKVGDDAFVCAGSIVFGNVKAGVKVIGNPAKIFRF